MAKGSSYGVPLQGAGGAAGLVPLGDHQHRGDFGETFVRMLAAAANLDATKRERDRVGIDWQLGHPGKQGTRRFPAIDVQVKCTTPTPVQDDHFTYELRVKNYNALAGREYTLPRFLFLVLAPADATSWTQASHDHLLLRHAAYWYCLHDREPLMDMADSSRRRIHVPRANLLTVDSLHELFDEDYRDMLGVS
ncbi:DUF4365 domain-containing protein [[Kitasatospora] papulosa]|uniref:DUF4365 domain-containing protein n=1 Tax=[Kitasatospora] papulosa TaxID=1464011 RepID=UPI00367BBE96